MSDLVFDNGHVRLRGPLRNHHFEPAERFRLEIETSLMTAHAVFDRAELRAFAEAIELASREPAG